MALQLTVGFSLYDWVLEKLPDVIKRWLPSILTTRLKPIADEWQKKGEELVSEKLAPVWDQIRPVVKVFTDLKGTGIDFFKRGIKLATDIEHEYTEIRNFKEDLHWRGRVVNAPQVVKRVKHLAEIPQEVAGKIKDMWKRLRDLQPEGKSPGELADEAANELEGIEDFRGLLGRLSPKLVKAGERILGVLALLAQILGNISAAIDDLQTIVNDIREIREDFEKLDLIFLPQEHKRRRVKLEDGRTIRLRIGGHLHPS